MIDVASFFLCIVLLCVALAVGILSARPFTWPLGWDTLRDIGIAQSILDKTYPEDPIFSGEVNWYNPLTGAILAVTSQVLNLPLPETAVRIGPFMQLLLPIGMMILAGYWFGTMGSLLILVYSLFARDPFHIEWLYACYTPWLLATQWGRIFLFLGLLFFIRYTVSERPLYLFLTGVCLGFGFLTHTSIFIELSIVMILHSIVLSMKVRKNSVDLIKQIKNLTIHLLIMFVTALLISSPFWLPIWLRYKFVIKNPYPSLYVTTALQIEHWPQTLQKNVNGFAIFGLCSLLYILFSRTTKRKYWFKIWLFSILILITHFLICQILNQYGYTFPTFFPAHHFAISFHTLIGFSFVYGLSKLYQIMKSKLTLFNSSTLNTFTHSLIIVLIIAFCVLSIPNPKPPFSEIYKGRVENSIVFDSAKYNGAYQWILDNTTPDDKFLCCDLLGTRLIMCTNRKLVQTMILYTSPYLNPSQHFSIYSTIWSAFREKRFSDFFTFLNQEKIRYVAVMTNDTKMEELDNLSFLSRAYEDNEVIIYKVFQ